MAPERRNVGASVRARLLERARAERSDFQVLLTRYALERLLYRLSVSTARERFVLKGAMLFATWLGHTFRPTRDLDLLGQGDPDAGAVAECFREICETMVPDDGVVFDAAGLRAAPIRDLADYGGVRVRTTAVIAGARLSIQIDVGFGDAITPDAVEIDYPTLLDQPSPRLRAYPPETVVAEKFEALVTLGVANTRMKDFYDLWLIARTFTFDAEVLDAALRRTFACRGTVLPRETPTGLSEEFATEKSALWRAFVGRERLGVAPSHLLDVVHDLRTFLMPLLADGERPGHWQPGGSWSDRGAPS